MLQGFLIPEKVTSTRSGMLDLELFKITKHVQREYASYDGCMEHWWGLLWLSLLLTRGLVGVKCSRIIKGYMFGDHILGRQPHTHIITRLLPAPLDMMTRSPLT